MINQCIDQACEDYRTVKVGDLIKLRATLGPGRKTDDYYLIVSVDQNKWKALFKGKIVTFNNMTSKSSDLVISRPTDA